MPATSHPVRYILIVAPKRPFARANPCRAVQARRRSDLRWPWEPPFTVRLDLGNPLDVEATSDGGAHVTTKSPWVTGQLVGRVLADGRQSALLFPTGQSR